MLLLYTSLYTWVTRTLIYSMHALRMPALTHYRRSQVGAEPGWGCYMGMARGGSGADCGGGDAIGTYFMIPL